MAAPTRGELASVRKSGSPRIQLSMQLTQEYADGETTERGHFPVVCYLRTDRQGRKDFLWALRQTGCRAFPAQTYGPEADDVCDAVDQALMGADKVKALNFPESSFPDAWVVAGPPERLIEFLSLLSCSHRKAGSGATLVRWEYLTTLRIGTVATGSGGGDGYRKPRIPVPLPCPTEGSRYGQCDNGNGMKREAAQTGRDYVPGPKRGYGN